MQPSFLALYKRGRYFRAKEPIGVDEDATAQRRHREQERFTAAAIAFCFRHDLEFRLHFWRSICRLPDDPEIPESPQIVVEPAAWADLLVRSTYNGCSYAHVIECKVGAGLAPHQDPRNPAFTAEDGYGQQLNRAFKGTELRYVVLGYAEGLGLPKVHPSLAIGLTQRAWTDLEEGYPRTALTEDLFDSLGEMGVGRFRMRKTRNIRVTAGLEKAGEAWDAFQSTIENLNLVERYCRPNGGSDRDSWSMGVHLLKLPQKKGVSDLHRRLQGIGESSGQFVAWFGYVSGEPATVRREVWLYCGDRTRAETVKKRLHRTYSDVELNSDDDQECVVVKDHSSSENDVEWFERRLRSIADLSLQFTNG